MALWKICAQCTNSPRRKSHVFRDLRPRYTLSGELTHAKIAIGVARCEISRDTAIAKDLADSFVRDAQLPGDGTQSDLLYRLGNSWPPRRYNLGC
jgi:hypothetical protein